MSRRDSSSSSSNFKLEIQRSKSLNKIPLEKSKFYIARSISLVKNLVPRFEFLREIGVKNLEHFKPEIFMLE